MANKKPSLLILGTGSEAAWAVEILAAAGNPFHIRGLVELGDAATKGQMIGGHVVLGSVRDLLSLTEARDHYIVATRSNRVRSDAARRAEVCGILPTQLLHPRASVASSARLEPSVLVHPGAVVGPHATIRAGSILNTNVVVDCFATIGPFAHVDVAARVGMRCDIASFATVGVGATVLPHLKVGRGAVVAPGAVVIEDVPDFSVVSGSPARVLRLLDRPRDEPSAGSIYEEYAIRAEASHAEHSSPLPNLGPGTRGARLTDSESGSRTPSRPTGAGDATASSGERARPDPARGSADSDSSDE